MENLPVVSGLCFFQLLTALLKETPNPQPLENVDVVSNQANTVNTKGPRVSPMTVTTV